MTLGAAKTLQPGDRLYAVYEGTYCSFVAWYTSDQTPLYDIAIVCVEGTKRELTIGRQGIETPY